MSCCSAPLGVGRVLEPSRLLNPKTAIGSSPLQSCHSRCKAGRLLGDTIKYSHCEPPCLTTASAAPTLPPSIAVFGLNPAWQPMDVHEVGLFLFIGQRCRKILPMLPPYQLAAQWLCSTTCSRTTIGAGPSAKLYETLTCLSFLC
jgi:hypothetical protein